MTEPWEEEPEGPHFFEAHGLRCAVTRGPMGAWCGYVAVPKGHPFFGKDSDANADGKKFSDVSNQPIGKRGIIPLLLATQIGEDDPITIATLIDVHGSLTYSGTGVRGIGDKDSWWFGFDCAHLGDIIPKLGPTWRDGVYRDLEYVKRETESLARQLAEEASS
jgi:hypothetical protein